MKKNKKMTILIGVTALVIVAAVIAVVLLNQGHRVIKVESVEGAVTLEREDDEKEIFEDMNLQSEDTITTGADGLIELLADSDKHIAATENTCFTIVSSGNEKEGRLKIELEYGTGLFEIENKLPDGSSFKVETPNAALSVRGTTFEVTYVPETNTTILKVIEGEVEAKTNTESTTVSAGGTAVITDEHIEETIVASTEGEAILVPPGDDEGNGTGTAEGGADTSLTAKVYIQDDEWPELLKGGADEHELENMIAIAKFCQDNGNEDYVSEFLKQMCYVTSNMGIYQPIEQSTAPAQYIYDIPTLNETFSFFTDEKIGEEHLYLDSYIEGDRLVCVYPEYRSASESVSVMIGNSYYGENEEIIMEDCTYIYVEMSTGEVVSTTITVHLIQDETGKYILDSIE